MKTILKLVACWAAFAVSLPSSWNLISALHLHMNAPVDSTPPTTRLLAFLAAGAVLVLGLYPLARGLAASRALLVTVLGFFLFLTFGVNTIIEVVTFSNAFNGAVPGYTLVYAVEVLLVASALGLCFAEAGAPEGFPPRGWLAWTGRGAVAWLAWLVIYFAFGFCVAPIVIPYYAHGGFPGLQIPPLTTILAVQLVRSLLFLASSLPLIALWKGSRRGLWLALGLAHAVAVGLFGMVSWTAAPAILRVTHSVEITGDSFAYAGLLVLLFAAPVTANASIHTI
ncbi:MAG: hypothetical protein ACLP07_11300 [Terracidiphilus sp.]